MADGSSSLSLTREQSKPSRRRAEGKAAKTPRTTFGGREDLLQVYHAAKDLIVKHKVLRIAHKEVDGDTVRLIICNLWRIERKAGQPLRFARFDLKASQWMPTTDLRDWPQIPIWPVTKTRDPEYARDVLKKAIWTVLDAAGMNVLQKLPPGVIDFNDGVGEEGIPIYSGAEVKKLRVMRPRQMGGLLVEHYAGKARPSKDGRGTRRMPGFVSTESIHAGGRALRAAFFEHIVEKELFSAALAIDYQIVNSTFYLTLGQHREAVLRIAQENRNLLPLLPWIKPEHWQRRDLFSRKLWVRGDRKSTLVDRWDFQVRLHKKDAKRLGSFESAKDWRWLHRAPTSLVRIWLTDGMGDRSTISVLTEANVSQRIPVAAYRWLVRQMNWIRRAPPRELLVALIRLHLLHVAKVWREKGHKAAVSFAASSNLPPMCDYLVAEGIAQGFPQRNSTWQSLTERSDDWHKRVAIESMGRQESEQRAIVWESALPETVIQEVTFTPLVSAYELAVEGYEQHHCVGDYAWDCMDGMSRVFAVRDVQGVRSTLELRIKPKTVTIGQHYEACNQPVKSRATLAAAKKIAQLYRKALVRADVSDPPCSDHFF